VGDQVGDREHHHDDTDVDVDPQMLQRGQLCNCRMGLGDHSAGVRHLLAILPAVMTSAAGV
jgi:hypothetical protein